MGSCISKSKPKSSSPLPPPSPSLPPPPSKAHESCFVQDKLVIISSHPPQVPSPSPSSASSSFPCTSTTNSCSSSASSITSCSSSSSSVSKDKSSSSSSSSSSSYSNDYLWSCIKENPHLINQSTLDKAHVIPQNLFHTRKTEPSTTKSTLSSSTKKKQQSVVHPTTQKRACSSSKTTTTTTTPSSPNIISRQKSFRRDHLQQLPEVERCRHQLITTTTTTTSSVPAGKRNSNLGTIRYSSSPIRRSKGGNNDTCKGISRINSPGRKKILNHDNSHEELGIYKNTNKSNIKETTTRPVIHPSSPQPYKRNRDGMGSRKKQIITSTTTTHHIYDDEVREEEAVLSSSCITDNHQEKEYYLNSAVVSSSTDDIDNPLISLDCFIFL